MRLIPLAFVLFLSACQVSKRPDLAKLYQQHGTDHSNTPLVLIHGTMGSKLRNKTTHEEVWPGKINKLIFSNYKLLANKISPDGLSLAMPQIESYEIFDSYSGLSIYDEIIKTLTKYGNYHLINLESKQIDSQKDLYIFHYDWRQDNVQNANHLAVFIDNVLKKYPQHQRVDVIAHSMGGLILRYYQRFGGNDVLENLGHLKHDIQLRNSLSQSHKIRHAIFLGTPQLGSVKAITRLQYGFDFNLRSVPVEVQVTMPSIYQLLPHPMIKWAADIKGQSIDINIFDVNLWIKNQWSIYNPKIQKQILKSFDNDKNGHLQIKRYQSFFSSQLKRAKLFWMSLSKEFEVAHDGFVIMGGDCKKTLNKLIVKDIDSATKISDDTQLSDTFEIRSQQKSALYEPGDGQVSKSSLLGAIHDPTTHQTIHTINIKYPIFVCEDHHKLVQNLTLQDNLLHVLLNN